MNRPSFVPYNSPHTEIDEEWIREYYRMSMLSYHEEEPDILATLWGHFLFRKQLRQYYYFVSKK
jgi:hypothetical protein